MGEIIEMNKKENVLVKVGKFCKKHKGKIIAGTVLLVGGVAAIFIGKNAMKSNGTWENLDIISENGLVRNAAKWNSTDEWNGVATGALHNMTMAEMCEVGSEIIKSAGLDENHVIEEMVFVTSKVVEND